MKILQILQFFFKYFIFTFTRWNADFFPSIDFTWSICVDFWVSYVSFWNWPIIWNLLVNCLIFIVRSSKIFLGFSVNLNLLTKDKFCAQWVSHKKDLLFFVSLYYLLFFHFRYFSIHFFLLQSLLLMTIVPSVKLWFEGFTKKMSLTIL